MTMTMDEKKAYKHATAPETATPEQPKLDWSRPIVVALVRFDRALQIPGASAAQTAKTDRNPTAESRVEFLAAVRMFRITFTARDKPARVAYVPEARVLSWEPAAS